MAGASSGDVSSEEDGDDANEDDADESEDESAWSADCCCCCCICCICSCCSFRMYAASVLRGARSIVCTATPSTTPDEDNGEVDEEGVDDEEEDAFLDLMDLVTVVADEASGERTRASGAKAGHPATMARYSLCTRRSSKSADRKRAMCGCAERGGEARKEA